MGEDRVFKKREECPEAHLTVYNGAPTLLKYETFAWLGFLTLGKSKHSPLTDQYT
uniref:Uncharacterized protein n=1 Tax=Anguilla anguilla TaxID=7936 RepID=A0A0E9XIP7_ANGAN